MYKVPLMVAAVAALGLSAVPGFANAPSAPIAAPVSALAPALPSGTLVADDDTDKSSSQQGTDAKTDDQKLTALSGTLVDDDEDNSSSHQQGTDSKDGDQKLSALSGTLLADDDSSQQSTDSKDGDQK